MSLYHIYLQEPQHSSGKSLFSRGSAPTICESSIPKTSKGVVDFVDSMHDGVRFSIEVTIKFP